MESCDTTSKLTVCHTPYMTPRTLELSVALLAPQRVGGPGDGMLLQCMAPSLYHVGGVPQKRRHLEPCVPP